MSTYLSSRCFSYTQIEGGDERWQVNLKVL
nr:MAG TPA: hypothetical protein [Caudoviricetes sp.]